MYINRDKLNESTNVTYCASKKNIESLMSIQNVVYILSNCIFKINGDIYI